MDLEVAENKKYKMDIYLDYKATVWFRIPISSEEALEKVLAKIKEGKTPSDLYNEFEEDEIGQCEPLYDTETFMDISMNEGYSTVEAYKDTKLIYENGTKI